MNLTDKIKIKDIEYMCTQILFLENIPIYRIHEIFGDTQLFVMEKDNNVQQIKDKKILKEIQELIKVKNTDIIVN